MTDGAGHGVLIATDNVYFSLLYNAIPTDGIAVQFTIGGGCDLLYRFKEVGLKEYIGIVQSQQ